MASGHHWLRVALGYAGQMPPPPSREANKFIVRLPDGMRDRIAEAARANGRSMNAEIVHRLERTLSEDGRPSTGAVQQELDLDRVLRSVLDDYVVVSRRRTVKRKSQKD